MSVPSTVIRPQSASSQPISCLSSKAPAGLLAEFAALHGERTGRKVVLTSLGGVDAAQLVREGQQTDVVVLAEDVMQELEAAGHILSGTLATVAVSEIAVAVPVDASIPDISTEAALRDAVLAASRIGYSTGPSGDYILQLFRSWGVISSLESRLVQAPTGVPVAKLLAERRVTLGFQQLSELVGQPGIVVLGLLPEPVQRLTRFTAGVSNSSQKPAAAGEFIGALTGFEADAVIRRHGMRSSLRTHSV